MSGSSYCFDPEIQRKARDYLYGGLRISLCKGIVFFLLGLLVLSLRARDQDLLNILTKLADKAGIRVIGVF